MTARTNRKTTISPEVIVNELSHIKEDTSAILRTLESQATKVEELTNRVVKIEPQANKVDDLTNRVNKLEENIFIKHSKWILIILGLGGGTKIGYDAIASDPPPQPVIVSPYQIPLDTLPIQAPQTIETK